MFCLLEPWHENCIIAPIFRLTQISWKIPELCSYQPIRLLTYTRVLCSFGFVMEESRASQLALKQNGKWFSTGELSHIIWLWVCSVPWGERLNWEEVQQGKVWCDPLVMSARNLGIAGGDLYGIYLPSLPLRLQKPGQIFIFSSNISFVASHRRSVLSKYFVKRLLGPCPRSYLSESHDAFKKMSQMILKRGPANVLVTFLVGILFGLFLFAELSGLGL